MSTTRPPVGDPKRQATDAVGGFVYQAWLSVDAWLRLVHDETLFLEQAEDFDRATDTDLEGVQIRRKGGELSLGRAEARDAISAFWTLRTSNSDRLVRYRHLTTASRGTERGDPFDGRCGLDVWDEARRSDSALAELRAFLVGQSLPSEVLNLLRTGSNEAVRQALVLPIHWDTDAPDLPNVRDVIDRRLIDHGQQQAPRVPPEASKRVAAALYARVMERSTEAGLRALTSADFAELFELETTERHPGGSGLAAAARAARTPWTRPQAGDPGFLEAVSGSHLQVVASRADLVTTIRDRAERFPLSALVGSSGMGKSTLAELAAGGEGWYRVDLRGYGPDALGRRLDDVAMALAELPDGSTVLIDDLNLTTGLDRYVTALGRLLTAATLQSIHLVVTAHAPLPSRILQLCPPPTDDLSYTVGALGEADLRDLTAGYGCPEAKLGVWVRTIQIKTAGHPQLAAAYAADARARGWPEPEMSDVLSDPASIEQVKTEARITLREALRDAGPFQLAQRLSVFTFPFTREQALRLANAPLPLATGALDLDVLIGPWIETHSDGRYSVSPLLGGLYRDTLVVETDRASLHSSAADAIAASAMAGKRLNVYDLSSLLSHGLMGQNAPALTLAVGLVRTAKDFSRVADYVDWLGAYETEGEPGPLVPSDPATSFLLREVQFAVAAETGRDVEPVLAAWDREIEALDASGNRVDGLRALRAGSVLTNLETRVSPSRLIRYASDLLSLPTPDGDEEALLEGLDIPAEQPSTPADLLGSIEASGRKRMGGVLPPSAVISMLSLHAESATDVAALIGMGLDAPLLVSTALSSALQSDVALTESIVSRAWTAESGKGDPDWVAFERGLNELVALARDQDLVALAVSAERGRAVMRYESLGDREAAETGLAEARDWLGASPRLDEYQGKILRMEGEHRAAVDFYEALMPGWAETDPNASRTYAFHDAIVSAGSLGDWERAAYWAEEGAQAAAPLDAVADAYVELCYRVDGAFALHKAGRTCKAVGELRGVVDRLPDPSDARVRMLHRRTTHVASWIYGEVGGLKTTGVPEPPPGLASQFEADPEENGVVVMEAEALVSILIESAVLAGCDPAPEEASPEGTSALTLSRRAYGAVNAAIREAADDLADRFQDAIVMAEQVTAEQEGRPLVVAPPEPEGLVTALTFGAMSAYAVDVPDPGVVERWRERLGKLVPLTTETHIWFGVLQSGFELIGGDPSAESHLAPLLQDQVVSSNVRLVAGAALARGSQSPVVRLQMLAMLTTAAAGHPFGMGVGGALASLAGVDAAPGKGAEAAAREILGSPLLPFLHLAPDLTARLVELTETMPTWGFGSAPTGDVNASDDDQVDPDP